MKEIQPLTLEEQWFHWDGEQYIPVVRTVTYRRPDQIGKRGGPICCVCGGRTRTVLDGEAWCDKCERYQ